MSRRMENLSQFILAITFALVIGWFTGWGLADLSRGYRSARVMKVQQDLDTCRSLKEATEKDVEVARLECKAKIQKSWETKELQGCRNALSTLEKDQAICYGLLKAGPPECMAAMLAYDLKVPKKKPAKKPKKATP